MTERPHDGEVSRQSQRETDQVNELTTGGHDASAQEWRDPSPEQESPAGEPVDEPPD